MARNTKLLTDFLVHVPNHLAAASKLFNDIPVTDIFGVGATAETESFAGATERTAMRIGIVADIHDAVPSLRVALRRFRELGVEQVVTLGDAFETFEPGSPGAQVARELAEAGAIGVWGNHDAGLSHALAAEVRAMADPALLAFGEGLRPQLVLGGCRFCHIEPWRDPCRIEDLWEFESVPETGEDASRSFRAVPERILFVGHFHTWRLIRPEGPVPWATDRPITLDGPDRYLALVSAVVEGWSAVFDTDTSELTPIRCPA